MSAMCGKLITRPVMDGLAQESAQQCALPAGHFGPCLTPSQVLA